MFHIRRRRTRIRIVSFIAAALTVSTTVAIYSSWLAYAYRRSIEYTYQRALSDLAVRVNNIDLDLQKGTYAGTPAQLSNLSAKIWRDASAAKSSLSQIPQYENDLAGTYKFISQVGDYANSLTKNLANAKTISADERKNMSLLSGFAQKLTNQLSDLMDDLHKGNINIFTAQNAVAANYSSSPSGQPAVDTGFKDIETAVSAMPALIYDGPFSDNVLKRKPLMTQGKAAVDAAKARAAASSFTGAAQASLQSIGSTAGDLATYNFSAGTATVCVTRAGGYVARFVDGRPVGDAKLGVNDARNKAAAFLRAHGIGSMKESYYQTNNSVCIVNYALVQNGVICYPDLIKVGVALDNGAIVSFDATGYLYNHKTRSFPAAKISADAAKTQVSPTLTVQSVRLALIPLEDANESLCYEIRCKSKSGQDVLDYYNVETGNEDQLLILLQTPGGVLAN